MNATVTFTTSNATFQVVFTGKDFADLNEKINDYAAWNGVNVRSIALY